MTVERLGVLGGSFNPVHLGHLHIARRCRDIFGFSKVFFVVACSPPHKQPGDLIPLAHRYAMVSLATAGIASFVPSLAELDPPASPYSIKTLAKLARHSGVTGEQMYFVAGGDSLLEVTGWHDSAKLLRSNNFVFVTRPGVTILDAGALLPPDAAARVVDCRGLDPGELQSRIAAGKDGRDCRIFLLDAQAPDIAASQIRRLASLGRPIDGLVPESVGEYISKLHLYGE